MADAEIIPIGTRGRPGRGSGRARPSSAARSLASPRPAADAPAEKAPRTSAQIAEKRPAGKQAAEETPAEKQAAGKPPAKKQPAKKQPPKKRAPEKQAPEKQAPEKQAPEKQAAAASVGPSVGTAASARKPPPPRKPRASGDRPQPGSGAGLAAERPPVTTAERGETPGIPLADWLAAIETGAREVFGDDWEAGLARFLAFLRRRLTGDYVVDEFGFDVEVTDRFVMAALKPIAEKWFRIEVRGLDNIPTAGGALVVSNHSGTIPMDGLMTMSTVFEHTGRHLRPLGADLVFRLPVVSQIARKTGATLACNEDAERMLRAGELVGVWPEGFKGIGKPFSERYKLQRFGRGGFVSAALRTGVPIVPLSVVGAEEIYPLVGNLPALARLLGVPYIPITPLFPWLGPLGLVPLPSKWLLEFGEPIRTDELDDTAADDPMLVFNVTDQVRETIQQTLYTLLMERASVFG